MLTSDQINSQIEELKQTLSQPDAFSSPDFADNSRKLNELEELLVLHQNVETLEQQLRDTQDLSQSSDAEMAEMATLELANLEENLKTAKNALEMAVTPRDPNDDKNVIVEVRAGAGGDEASLFAGDLHRMYSRYAEGHNLKVELISQSPSEGGGYKEIIFEVKGKDAYRQLKFESGVHRVQRIPVTESQGRIHTSTATVAVMPEADEHDVEINEADLKIDTYRASGHGGQSVNTTDSAIRITHLPTGVVVTCQDEKSQIKNKAKALGVLRSRLLAKQIEEQQSAESEARRKLIGSGDRSEKIRTYNIPQDRVTDHRIGYSRAALPKVLDGEIDDIIEELLKHEQKLIQELS